MGFGGLKSDSTQNSRVLHGGAIIREIKSSHIDFVISVPDIVTSEGILRPLAREQAPRLVRVCREDECVGIAAGLAFCNKRALVLIQHTGLLNSINAIRAVAVEYALPICMMVGLLGKEPGTAPKQSKKYSVRIVETILDAMGIMHYLIEDDADIGKIQPAIDAAYASSRPVVLMLGQRPVS
jgi:sulfopyruvate decarboxylase TPP-binding subunit